MPEKNFKTSFPELSTLGVEVELPVGAVLWKEGEPGDQLVVLLEGFLQVTHETPDGEAIVLRTIEPGAMVGEMAILDGQARSATVKASTRCRILRIPAADFRALLRERPDILEEMFWMQLQRVRSLTWRVSKIHQRAITDMLTRLYNFGFFRERLSLELERARQTGDMLSLAMFDIDHFKRFNDRHGHQEGNKVLAKVAEIMKSTGRKADIVARYGGEEFVVLLYGVTREEAARFAESVRRAIEGHEFPGGETQPLGRVTLSGGVATYPLDAQLDDELIAAADRNLYRAKEAGRNRIGSMACAV